MVMRYGLLYALRVVAKELMLLGNRMGILIDREFAKVFVKGLGIKVGVDICLQFN
jgi:hypothetical protein